MGGGAAAAAPCLQFRGVTFEIPLRGGGTKRILSDVSGWCAPGAVTALSGPSGGGKTTLLDALGSCIYGGRLAGTVLVDGTPADVWRAQPGHTAAYVQQHVSALPGDSWHPLQCCWETRVQRRGSGAALVCAMLLMPYHITRSKLQLFPLSAHSACAMHHTSPPRRTYCQRWTRRAKR